MGQPLFNIPQAPDTDWTSHNEASAQLWEAFKRNEHDRVPIRFNTNPRMIMLDPVYNPDGVTYERYFNDPETMVEGILSWQYWMRHFLPGDHQKGLPEGWLLWFDIQNTYDAVWFGCPIHYRTRQVPDTTPFLTDDTKNLLFDRGLPEPFAGEWVDRCLEYCGAWKEKMKAGWEWHGRPISTIEAPCFLNTDGVFTGAVALRGANELCMDLLMDPDYAHRLLEYVYEATRTRMRAWRERYGVDVPKDDYVLADDAIQMLSEDHYREFVLPWHIKLYDEFGTQTGRGMHLCGNAQRHFTILHETCNVRLFDTGFPIDFTALRRDLGPDVTISGGPKVFYFLNDDPEPVVAEVERICGSGILEGGRFILQEGNNLAPTARLSTCEAFYEAGKRFGKIVRSG